MNSIGLNRSFLRRKVTKAGECNASKTVASAAPKGMGFAGLPLVASCCVRAPGRGIAIQRLRMNVSNRKLFRPDVLAVLNCAARGAVRATPVMCEAVAFGLASVPSETHVSTRDVCSSSIFRTATLAVRDNAAICGQEEFDLVKQHASAESRLWAWQAGFGYDCGKNPGGPFVSGRPLGARSASLALTVNSRAPLALTLATAVSAATHQVRKPLARLRLAS